MIQFASRWGARRLAAFAVAAAVVSGCRGREPEPISERYETSEAPLQVSGRRMDLKELQRAFRDAHAPDFRSWMQDFEQRANDLYSGMDGVSVAATREGDKVTVLGYIDRNRQTGFQPGDEVVFRLQQSGDLGKVVRQVQAGADDVQRQMQRQMQILTEQNRQNQKQFQLAIEQTKRSQQQIAQAIEQVSVATRSLNKVMDNVVGITEKANRIAGRAERTADDLAPQLQAIMGNVQQLTRSVDGTIRGVDALLRTVNATIGGVNGVINDPATQRHLAATAANVDSLTRRIDGLIADLHEISGDPAVRDDIKGLIREARHAVANAGSLTQQIRGVVEGNGGVALDLGGEFYGAGGDAPAQHVQANLLGRLDLGAGALHLGLAELGGRNLFDLQYGLRLLPPLGLRAGIVRGRLGLGADLRPLPGTALGLSIFDTRTPSLRVVFSQRLFGQWGLAAFYQHTFATGAAEYGLGASWHLRGEQ